jgi:hypothetical protein
LIGFLTLQLLKRVAKCFDGEYFVFVVELIAKSGGWVPAPIKCPCPTGILSCNLITVAAFTDLNDWEACHHLKDECFGCRSIMIE